MRDVAFSLPTAVYESLLQVDGVDVKWYTDGWSAILRLCEDAPSEFNFTRVADLVFFEVLQASPDKRDHVAFHHLDRFSDIVHVTRRAKVSVDAEHRRVMLLSKAGAVEQLHLRLLLSQLDSLSSLYVWRVGYHMTAEGVRRRPQPLSLTAGDIAPMVPPSASGALAVRQSSETVSTVTPITSDDIAASAFRQIDLAPAVDDSGSKRFQTDWHYDTLVALANDGAVVLEQDEFGELLVRKVPEGIRHVNLYIADRPEQLIHRRHCNPASKLDLVIRLLREEWRDGTPDTPWSRREPKLFYCRPARATSYFACLVRSEELLAKGVKTIPHDFSDVQYQCLLRLHGSALAQFLAKVASGDANCGWCRSQVKKFGDRDHVRDAGDVGEQPDDDVGEHADAVQRLVSLVPAILDKDSDQWRRAIVHMEGYPDHKVIFDHFSHQSGRQRGYVLCQAGHENCSRWRFCDESPDREHFIASLVAWSINGDPASDPSEHIASDPPADLVALVLISQSLEDF